MNQKIIGAFLALILTRNLLADSELNARLQKELGKMDSWVLEEVQADYRPGASETKRVKFRIVPESRRLENEKLGIAGTAAQYARDTDSLLIHEKWDDEGMEALSHELWHAAYDEYERPGIMKSPLFSGPTRDEIKEYCAQFMKRPALASAIHDLSRNLLSVFLSDAQHTLSRWLARNEKALGIVAAALNRYIELGELAIFFPNREILDKDIASFNKKEAELSVFRDSLRPRFEELEKKSKENALTDEREAALFHREFKEFVKKSEVVGDFMPTALDFAKKVYEGVWRAQKTYFEDGIKELEKQMLGMKDERLRAQTMGTIELLKKRLTSSRDQYEKQAEIMRFQTSGLGLENFARDLLSVGNTVQYAKALTDPDEVMGRIVESLYILHLGPATLNRFPLEEEDLAFLSKFAFNGVPMFRKGIERYRIALAMKETGKSPEWIRKDLEYAHEYQYNNVHYRWMPTVIMIEGEIPKVEE